jgi:hypothetical protein
MNVPSHHIIKEMNRNSFALGGRENKNSHNQTEKRKSNNTYSGNLSSSTVAIEKRRFSVLTIVERSDCEST